MNTVDSNSRSESDFIEILLLATRQCNADVLETHLSTVQNPDLYLNQVYDESNEQKCTLLMIACLNGHGHIIHMLLDRFKPDLEILNNILLDDIHPIQKLYLDVSVLWVVAAIDNFNIVKLLIEHGANVNHTTQTKSTPLRCTCRNGNIEMARYLIEKGANRHIVNERNETNLMVSASYNHMHMVTYLINELNYDVNACDNDGRTALYDAVSSKSVEMVEFLLKHGACNFHATVDRMSPLMWAAEKRQTDLMNVMFDYCSLLERIEAEELLGSAFICVVQDDPDLEQAFPCFYRALKLRLNQNIPKTSRSVINDIFDNRQECQTLDELEAIRYNFDNMYIEALLVRERLLGLDHEKYRDSVVLYGALLADSGENYKALKLWMYELELRQQHSISFNSHQLREVVSLISEMISGSMLVSTDGLLTLLALINGDLELNSTECNNNLCTLLFLITIITKSLNKSISDEADRVKFYQLLWKINRHRYVTSDQKRSLLHLSLDEHTSTDDYDIKLICKYPCLQTAQILLECGADINEIDSMGNTSLHIFVSNELICDESILKLLCDAGAHIDYVNALAQSPFNLASNSIIKQLLNSQMHLSLKCLCARLIQKHSLPYYDKLSISLVNFVTKH